MVKTDKKVLWFDTETTGVDKKENALIQLAAIMEVNNEVVDEIELLIKPFKGQIVTRQSIQIHGFTMERLRSDEFIPPREAHGKFLAWLNPHIKKRDKTDKAYVGGQNVGFDIDFLVAFFERLEDPYLGSWINWRKLDALNLAHVCAFLGIIPALENFKLETLCNFLGVTIKAHDAVSDIKAAREVFYKLLARLAERISGKEHCPSCDSTVYKDGVCWLCGLGLNSVVAGGSYA